MKSLQTFQHGAAKPVLFKPVRPDTDKKVISLSAFLSWHQLIRPLKRPAGRILASNITDRPPMRVDYALEQISAAFRSNIGQLPALCWHPAPEGRTARDTWRRVIGLKKSPGQRQGQRNARDTRRGLRPSVEAWSFEEQRFLSRHVWAFFFFFCRGRRF